MPLRNRGLQLRDGRPEGIIQPPNLVWFQDAREEGRDRHPKERGDVWLEIGLGAFFCEGGCDREMEVSASEVKRLWWKGGLIIQGIEIRPNESETM